MESGHEGYSLDVIVVVAFLVKNFRSRERTNFVNGLLNSLGTMAPGTKVTLQISDM